MIRVAITDDSRPVRENLARILAHFEALEIAWIAADGDEAIARIEREGPRPEVILMDIEMRRVDGVAATRRIRELAPEVRIIMLTIFEQEEHIFNAIRAGASGYLLKDERPARIYQAIQDVHEGRMPMSPLVAAKALALLRTTDPPSGKTPQDYQLTPREIEILAPLANGRTYAEIAETLFISPNTVRRHIENIYRKLEVSSKVEASKLAAKHRWF